MGIIQTTSDSAVIKDNRLQLLDGSWITCYPKAEPSEPVDNTMALDTTGQYLSLGREQHETPINKKMEDTNRTALFVENVPCLLDHADEILSDSRMFLAPSRIVNCLAYTGTSGFRRATLGVYLEWWRYQREASIDLNGNHIWFISGSPMSGSNCCQSIDSNGKSIKSRLNSFLPVWTTFSQINTRYDEAKSRFEAYSFEDVLLKIRGTGYHRRIIDIRWEAIMKTRLWDMNRFERTYEMVSKRIRRLIRWTQKNLLKIHKNEIDRFYDELVAKETEINRIHDAGGEAYAEKCQELSDFTIDFIIRTFGYNYITLSDIICEVELSRVLKMNGENRIIQ